MSRFFASVLITAMLLLVFSTSANAQDAKEFQELVVRLVQSASVKPGNVVVVEGGKHMIP